jgi:cytochrome c-type biogenesis protein CcmH/NrfG
MNRHAEALEVLRRANRDAPENAGILAALAWLLATSPDPSLRDGPRAVEFAERAVAAANRPDLRALESLAAAYAEAGRFDDAVRVATRVVERARSSGQDRLVRQAEARLELYRAHRPYRAGTR